MGSKGGTTTAIDARLVFKVVLEQNATAIILIHHYPSGKLQSIATNIHLIPKKPK